MARVLVTGVTRIRDRVLPRGASARRRPRGPRHPRAGWRRLALGREEGGGVARGRGQAPGRQRGALGGGAPRGAVERGGILAGSNRHLRRQREARGRARVWGRGAKGTYGSCTASSAEIFGNAGTPVQNESTPVQPLCPLRRPPKLPHTSRSRSHAKVAEVGHEPHLLSRRNRHGPERFHFVFRKITRTVAAIACGDAKELVLGTTSVIRDFCHAKDLARREDDGAGCTGGGLRLCLRRRPFDPGRGHARLQVRRRRSTGQSGPGPRGWSASTTSRHSSATARGSGRSAGALRRLRRPRSRGASSMISPSTRKASASSRTKEQSTA